MTEGQPYEIKTIKRDEAYYVYSHGGRDEETGCIGHLRADFGQSGKEFWSTWFDHCADLKTQAFKDELDGIINHLREDGNMLASRSDLTRYCYAHPSAQLGVTARNDAYGFRIDTDKYSYLIRGMHMPGDYNLHYAYQRDKLEQCLAAVRQAPEPTNHNHEQTHELKMDGM